MIIYNTTYQVNDTHTQQFLEWIRTEYVPKAVKSGVLMHAQLTRIMHHTEGCTTYALQFHAESMSALQGWFRTTGNALNQALALEFGANAPSFSTMMQVLDLK